MTGSLVLLATQARALDELLPCCRQNAQLWFSDLPAELQLAKHTASPAQYAATASPARSSDTNPTGSGAARSSPAARSSRTKDRAAGHQNGRAGEVGIAGASLLVSGSRWARNAMTPVTAGTPADYELLTAADDLSVVRCRIANSVHQMHEASGRILASATPLCFTRSPRTRPGPADQTTGWLCLQAATMVDGGQVNQVRRPVACRYVAAVPELSAGLPSIPGLPWESLSHRQVLAELAAGGWVPCGVGDRAVALRSREGSLVADMPV